MIFLSKSNLYEMARILVLANTAGSLYQGLLSCNGVMKMRKEATSITTKNYYDYLTARAKSSEFSVSLAYATLIATLLNDDNNGRNSQIDSQRLNWGLDIELLAKNEPTNLILRLGGLSTRTPEMHQTKIILDTTLPSQTNTNWITRNV